MCSTTQKSSTFHICDMECKLERTKSLLSTYRRQVPHGTGSLDAACVIAFYGYIHKHRSLPVLRSLMSHYTERGTFCFE
jgi:hypothetical protein